MFQRLRQYGLGARFLAFVLITMMSSLILGSLIAGLASYLVTGDSALLLFVPMASVTGGGFAIPIALLLWYLPSAVIFSASMAAFEGRIETLRATQWSGSITACIAALVTTYAASDFGRHLEGAGHLMLFIGPAAVALAPWAARKAFNLS